MRTRINLLMLAVVTLVIIAFAVPIGVLVRARVENEARVSIEREVQQVVAVVVQASAVSGSLDIPELTIELGEAVSIRDEEGAWVGGLEPDVSLVAESLAHIASVSAETERGWELAVPVLVNDRTVVISGLASSADLTEGVGRIWALLGLLCIGVLGVSLLVADRLAMMSVTRPAHNLADAAVRLGSGDLDTPVVNAGPRELRQIGSALSVLSTRIRELLAEERESVADLSHRLRTPLTALRLGAEDVDDPNQRQQLLAGVVRMEGAVDRLIREARSQPESGTVMTSPAEVAEDRTRFWAVLARSQDRDLNVEIEATGPVAASSSDLAAAIDALMGNVLRHTEAGTPLELQSLHPARRLRSRWGTPAEGSIARRRS